MNGIKSYWWKAIGVALVLYSIYLGTSTKVGPGVVQITPNEVAANSNFELVIEGYNTEFNSNDTPKVWYKVLNRLQKANDVSVLDANHLKASFNGVTLKADSNLIRGGSIVIEDSHHGLFLGSKMLRLKFNTDLTATNDSLIETSDLPAKLEQSYFSFPYRYVLYETIRNLNFHVPMWFVMTILLLISFIFSIRYLNKGDEGLDVWANAFAKAGLLFGLIGIGTGMFWANYTWGTPWTRDPKLNGAAVAVLMYIAYQILRSSIDDEGKVARISAVYNIFAFPIFIVLIMVLPKMAAFSLHPGAGDSVAFSNYDLNDHLKKVFYPASLGWILVGVWIAQVTGRIDKIIKKREWS